MISGVEVITIGEGVIAYQCEEGLVPEGRVEAMCGVDGSGGGVLTQHNTCAVRLRQQPLQLQLLQLLHLQLLLQLIPLNKVSIVHTLQKQNCCLNKLSLFW